MVNALVSVALMLPHWTHLDSRLLALVERFGPTVCTSEPVFDGANWLHITASARVWNSQRTHIIQVWSAKNERFQLPGAHSEGDFDLRSIALREANRAAGSDCELLNEEATGVLVREVAQYWNTPVHLHLEVVWEFQVKELELRRGARWVVVDASSGIRKSHL